jgi:hypothetical protein
VTAKAPKYATDVRHFIERNRTLRYLQKKYDIGGQLQKKAAELPGKLGNAASILADIGLGLVNSIFALVTILILAAFMLARGPEWRDAILRLQPPERASAWRQVSDDVAAAVGNYVGGAVVQALIAGVSSYVVLLILGVPFRVPLAVLVGVFDLIPLVGATLAAVLVGIVTAFVDSRTHDSPGNDGDDHDLEPGHRVDRRSTEQIVHRPRVREQELKRDRERHPSDESSVGEPSEIDGASSELAAVEDVGDLDKHEHVRGDRSRFGIALRRAPTSRSNSANAADSRRTETSRMRPTTSPVSNGSVGRRGPGP